MISRDFSAVDQLIKNSSQPKVTTDIEKLQEALLQVKITNQLLTNQTTELKDIWDKLTTQNQQKRELLNSLKEGQTESRQMAHEQLKFPCKLNDYRFRIENLSSDVTEDNLKNYFDSFGVVIDVFISKEKPREKRRTGIITFSHYYDQWPGKSHSVPLDNSLAEITLEHLDDYHHDGDSSTNTVMITGDIGELSGDSIRKYLSEFDSCFSLFNDFRRALNFKNDKFSRFVFVIIEDPAVVDKILSVTNHVIENVNVDIIRIDY